MKTFLIFLILVVLVVMCSKMENKSSNKKIKTITYPNGKIDTLNNY